METRRTVAVLGGSFDPVHVGHLHVADQVWRAFSLSEVILLPCAVPAHKNRKLTWAGHRLAMLRLAIGNDRHLRISTLEFERSGVSYTIDSLRALVAKEPSLAPLFVVGLDWLSEIHTWHEWRDLLREFDLVAVDRPGVEVERLKHSLEREVSDRIVAAPVAESEGGDPPPGDGGRIFHLPIPHVGVSSSEVRARAAEGAPLTGLVPPRVARYIHTHRLFQREESN
jgi:nicotinate-nucleotide adenylyltransferase